MLVDVKGFEKSWRSQSVPNFIQRVKETQSFNHLSDEVIRGWILGRFELEIYGQRSRASAYWVDVKCPKCRGKGWFGRGRPDCPACVAQGKEPIWKERRWNVDKAFSGYAKRCFITTKLIIGLIDKDAAEWKYAYQFDVAARHTTPYYPAWVDDVVITGKHSKKDKAEYCDHIRMTFTQHERTPKVKGHRVSDESVFNQAVEWEETICRMAKTFGCTCPITGQYVAQDEVSFKDETFRTYLEELTGYVAPLGFYARTRRLQYHGIIHTSPFSRAGIKAIQRAVTECRKAMGGEVNAEWVLAEVMQSRVFKHAA